MRARVARAAKRMACNLIKTKGFCEIGALKQNWSRAPLTSFSLFQMQFYVQNCWKSEFYFKQNTAILYV